MFKDFGRRIQRDVSRAVDARQVSDEQLSCSLYFFPTYQMYEKADYSTLRQNQR